MASACETCGDERYVNRWDAEVGAYEDVPSPCPDCNVEGADEDG